MNPLVYWADQLGDIQANHVGHWFALLWVVFQVGCWFGLGFRLVTGIRRIVKVVDK